MPAAGWLQAFFANATDKRKARHEVGLWLSLDSLSLPITTATRRHRATDKASHDLAGQRAEH